MSKLSKDFLICTFSIMIICWGLCIVCSLFGIYMSDIFLLYVPYLLGGWSPTIASYWALKKNHGVKDFKDWLKHVFDFKQNVFSYLMVVVLGILATLPECFVSGYEKSAPLFTVIFMIPVMLFGGGLEEAGWRYILQPEMEKKYSGFIATILVGIIWWVWHLPLFFVQGVAQNGLSILSFGIKVMGLSFALASIKKNTNSVWLCVLFHCLVNSLSGIYSANDTIAGSVVTALVLVLASFLFNKIYAAKKVRS